MSHFSVVVCIDDSDGKIAAAAGGPGLHRAVTSRLEQILAPWDEGLQVGPYRDYEEGEPSAHWLYRSLKRGEEKADAEAFASLPEKVTWADIARLYNERYGGDGESLLIGDDGRAYTMSTYNPESKWDWWAIGGSWAGYFIAREGAARRVIAPQRNHRSAGVIMPGRCDGGFRADLDLDALRKARAAEAAGKRAEWLELVAGTPEALPWKSFTDRICETYVIEQARDEYHSQPRIQAISQTDFRWYDDPVAEFGQPERLYVLKAMARAVPGYAIVTADGRWMAPGRMGWFGASTDEDGDRIGYQEAANAYIEALPGTAFLVAVDCHI